MRDTHLIEYISRVHQQNDGVYGARKVWSGLNREGIIVSRCTVERLMRAHGLHSTVRGQVNAPPPSTGPLTGSGTC